jgi:transposase-like protein
MEKMSQRQWKRLEAVERLSGGELSTEQAAQVLGICERQVRRVRRAVEERGAQGVVHGNTGRSPKQRVAKRVRERIVKLRLGT